MTIRLIWAVFRKELRSEFKTRYALNAVLMFVLTTVTMIAFSTREERLEEGVAAAMLWVILFFSSMSGLAKTFVSEEERGTGLLLKLMTSNTAVYFGKLLYNTVLTLLLFLAGIALFFVFIDEVSIKTPQTFWAVALVGGIGIAAATTLVSAIIARAGTKNALFPVLSFPILLPLILAGVESTGMALAGIAFAEALGNLQIMFSYAVVLISVSYMLFDFVWND